MRITNTICIALILLSPLQYKLCKVKRVQTGPKNVPFLTTHDGRTIRYPDPLIKVNDTIQYEIATSKILDHIRFEPGGHSLIMITLIRLSTHFQAHV